MSLVRDFLTQIVTAPPGGTAATHRFRNFQYPYTLENPDLDLNNYANWQLMVGNGGGQTSIAGVHVGTKDLLCYAPVMRSLKILGAGLSCSPMHVRFTHRQGPGENNIDEKHPCDLIVSRRWNENTTAAAGWKRFIQEAGTFGQAYAYAERSHNELRSLRDKVHGNVTGLYHLNPLTTKPCFAKETGYLTSGNDRVGALYVEEGEKYYESVIGGVTVYFHAHEVIEYRMFYATDITILELLKNTVGLAMASQGMLGKFFANGGQAGGFISVPAGTTAPSALNLQKELQKRQNQDSWFKVHLLRDGAKFEKLTVDPQTSAMHAIDENSARRVYDFYNINPHIAGLPGSDSYGAGESARTAHVVNCLYDHMNGIAQECRLKMMTPRQQKERGDKARDFWFDTSYLTKPDWAAFLDGLLKLANGEVINRNEVRHELGLVTRQDDKAEQFYNSQTKSNKPGEDSSGDDPLDDELLDDTDEGDTLQSTQRRQSDRMPASFESSTDGSPEPSSAPPTADAEITTLSHRTLLERGFSAAASRIDREARKRIGSRQTAARQIQSRFDAFRNIVIDEIRPACDVLQIDEDCIQDATTLFLGQLTDGFTEALPDGERTAKDRRDAMSTAARLLCYDDSLQILLQQPALV